MNFVIEQNEQDPLKIKGSKVFYVIVLILLNLSD